MVGGGTGTIGLDRHAEFARVLARRPDAMMPSRDDVERLDLLAALPVERRSVSFLRAPR